MDTMEISGNTLPTKHEIEAYCLSVFSRHAGKTVYSTNLINTLMNEMGPKFARAVTEIYRHFGISEEVRTPHDSNNVEIQVFFDRLIKTMVSAGNASDPIKECTGMDPYWRAIWYVLNAPKLSNVSFSDYFGSDSELNRFSVTKEQALKLCTCKSYAEFKQGFIRVMIEQGVNDCALLADRDLAFRAIGMKDLSQQSINPRYAGDVYSAISDRFGMTFDYDINDPLLMNRLYDRVFSHANESKLIRDSLGVPEDTRPKRPNPPFGAKCVSRVHIADNFQNLLNNTLGREVRLTKETIGALSDEAAKKGKPNIFQSIVDNYQNKYGITIDLNSDLTVTALYDSINKSLAKLGFSEYITVMPTEKQFVWWFVNKCITSYVNLCRHLKRFHSIEELSGYQLANCRTFDEYKKLLNAGAIFTEIRPFIATTLGLPKAEVTFDSFICNLTKDSSKLDELYCELGKKLGIFIPAKDRTNGTIRSMMMSILAHSANSSEINQLIDNHFSTVFDFSWEQKAR